MPKPYDAASKAIIEACPEAWLRVAGHAPQGPALVTVVNVDLSAVTSAADYAIQVQDMRSGETWLAHIEFVSGRQHGLPQDLALRNSLLHRRSGHPVRTIVILLHPDASLPELSGLYETWIADQRQASLAYQVIRIYEMSVAELLNGPSGMLPMAVLSREVRVKADVGPILDRLHDRLAEELAHDPGSMKNLWTTAELFLGLKFKGEENKDWIKSLTRGVLSVKDSIIYQDILDEGRIEGRKEGRTEGRVELLLRLGSKRWGAPGAGEKVALEAIADIERLDRMFDRLMETPGDLVDWDALLRVS